MPVVKSCGAVGATTPQLSPRSASEGEGAWTQIRLLRTSPPSRRGAEGPPFIEIQDGLSTWQKQLVKVASPCPGKAGCQGQSRLRKSYGCDRTEEEVPGAEEYFNFNLGPLHNHHETQSHHKSPSQLRLCK
mmetsp:Transcript_63425/g.100863  ORF Transcript_63425/g.100863 Transcript_63425/m.100863 type:complete len:131 (-) Transcript_63425:101-493(-)